MKNTQNRPRQAIALNYDGQSAPTLSAKGDAELAEAILAIAREHQVPIYENGELVKLLARLELGDAIPEALYRTMAEIIAFAWYLKGKSPAPRPGAQTQPALLTAPDNLPVPTADERS